MVKISVCIALHMSTYLDMFLNIRNWDMIEYLKSISMELSFEGFLTYTFTSLLCSFVNSDSHTQNVFRDGQNF